MQLCPLKLIHADTKTRHLINDIVNDVENSAAFKPAVRKILIFKIPAVASSS